MVMMSKQTLPVETDGEFFLNFYNIDVDSSVDVAATNVVIQTDAVVILIQWKDWVLGFIKTDHHYLCKQLEHHSTLWFYHSTQPPTKSIQLTALESFHSSRILTLLLSSSSLMKFRWNLVCFPLLLLDERPSLAQSRSAEMVELTGPL